MRQQCQEHFPRHQLKGKQLDIYQTCITTCTWLLSHKNGFLSDSGHAHAMMHVGITNPRWWGRYSRHFQLMRNPQFYVSDKRTIELRHRWLLGFVLMENKNILGTCRSFHRCPANAISTNCLTKLTRTLLPSRTKHIWNCIVPAKRLVVKQYCPMAKLFVSFHCHYWSIQWLPKPSHCPTSDDKEYAYFLSITGNLLSLEELGRCDILSLGNFYFAIYQSFCSSELDYMSWTILRDILLTVFVDGHLFRRTFQILPNAFVIKSGKDFRGYKCLPIASYHLTSGTVLSHN